MSFIGLVLSMVFGSNALLVYGFGFRPCLGRDRIGLGQRLLALGVINLIISSLVWLLEVLALGPFGLDALEPLLLTAFMAPLVRRLARIVGIGQMAGLGAFSRALDDVAPSNLVFGIALLAAWSGFGLVDALVASTASVFGYWASIVLLDAIRDRLELSDLPAPFRGAPAMLISAGLMAMAFMGIDAAIAINLGVW